MIHVFEHMLFHMHYCGLLDNLLGYWAFYPITRTRHLYCICILFALMNINKGFLLLTWYQSTNLKPNPNRYISSSSFLSSLHHHRRTPPASRPLTIASNEAVVASRRLHRLHRSPLSSPEALGVIAWCRRGVPKDPDPPVDSSFSH